MGHEITVFESRTAIEVIKPGENIGNFVLLRIQGYLFTELG
jgi:hypothetical protein